MISPCCLSVHALWTFINRLINYHKTWHKHYASQHRPEEVNKPPNVLTTLWWRYCNKLSVFQVRSSTSKTHFAYFLTPILKGRKRKKKEKRTCRQDNISFPGRLLTFFSGASAFPLAILEYEDKMYRAIILHTASHKCETWFLTLREEHMLMVFKENIWA
jgi:hypothetical protein